MIRRSTKRLPTTRQEAKKSVLFLGSIYVVLFLLVLLAERRFPPRTDTPRPEELYTSDEEFIDCVARLLRLAARDGNQAPFPIPLLVVPVTLDVTDMKTFFCNLSVPVKRILLINSGTYPPLNRVLLQLENAVSAPEQLFVRHHPENLGYAASVNLGFRMALDLGYDKVPFVFVSNSDTRFVGSVLQDLIAETVARTRNDAARLRHLQREVENEAEKVGSNGQSVNVWNGHYDTGTVVTSRWLPSRVRRMREDNVGVAFRNHYALLFPHPQPIMCSFFVTHLALATVGLLDENFYPAYGEDYDYLFRVANLGFQLYTSSPHRDIHYGNANLLKVPLHHPMVWSMEARPQLLRFNRMNYEFMRVTYRQQKWFAQSRKFNDARENRSTFPFDGRMPIDAWVKDLKRVEVIRQIGEGTKCAKDYVWYNLSLIDDVV